MVFRNTQPASSYLPTRCLLIIHSRSLLPALLHLDALCSLSDPALPSLVLSLFPIYSLSLFSMAAHRLVAPLVQQPKNDVQEAAPARHLIGCAVC